MVIIHTGCTQKYYDCNKPENIARISKNSYVVLRSRGHGMFSILDDVVSLVRAYERQEIAGVKIDFADSGLYYDPKHGPNWFSYYFEPIELGNNNDNNNVVYAHCLPYHFDATISGLNLYAIDHIELDNINTAEINKIVAKYIKIKPEIRKEIKDFTQQHFTSKFMIGIHYRGTDKISEAVRTPYDKVNDAINNLVINKQDYKIFIATDENNFIDYIKAKFSSIVYQDAIRSSSDKPIHFDNENPYQAGKEALIDAVLLSETNHLIRTSSNLSRWSTYFNPSIVTTELSTRR